MRVWSLIKLVPQRRLSDTRSSLAAHLFDNAHMKDDELVVVALKYLHRLDGPPGKSRSETEAKENDVFKEASSDQKVAGQPAESVPKPRA